MESAEASWFETSEILAESVASTPLLLESWRLCSLTYSNSTSPASFVVDQVGGVGYVGFSAVQSVEGLNLNENQLVAVDSRVFSSLRGEDVDPPMVHAGFLHLFLSVYNNREFQNKMLVLMEQCRAITFTGHSIGGVIASLAALWLMSHSSHHSVISVTFGSPLLGNESLAKAILRERWGGNFINVVSKHDIVPRLLLAPLILATAQLDGLLQFWLLSMTSPHFRHLASQWSDNQEIHAFHQYILTHVTAAATAEAESMRSPYRPFGSYIFCSNDGAICLDNMVAVVKMLHLLFGDSSVSTSIVDHFSYGDIVMQVSQQILKRKGFREGLHISDSSYKMGILSALSASGLKTDTIAQQARDCLMQARQMGCAPNHNSTKLAIRLAKVTPYRAQIEWYMALCDDSENQMGYYDSFKRASSKRDFKVNMNRVKLGQFWDDVVDMVESNQLPHDFHTRAKWVNASLSYKLHIEPLDIADYYKTGMHLIKGHYLKHGRARRYEVFDKWWRDRKVPIEENYRRSKFAGLTQDSCFWAKVEEANEWVKNARTQNDPQKLAQIWENIGRFEVYARSLVERKEVSKDVVAINSSYSMWLNELKELKSLFMQMPPRYHGYVRGEIVP